MFIPSRWRRTLPTVEHACNDSKGAVVRKRCLTPSGRIGILVTVTERLRWRVRKDTSMERALHSETLKDFFVSLRVFRGLFSTRGEPGLTL